MHIVLINWSDGENDPFTLFNQCLSEKFSANGRDTITVSLDSDFGKNMSHALGKGVDFALTWQGLGSTINVNALSETTFWDELKIPLICLHGDHPCHMITHHSGLPEFVHHLYGAGSFAQYANRYIPRSRPARIEFVPNFFHQQSCPPDQYTGDFFVFPKNYDDTINTLKLWNDSYPELIYHLLLDITEAIKAEFNNGNSVHHHQIVDQHLTAFYFDVLKDHFGTDDDLLLRHHVHALVDKFYRNFVSERVLIDLADVKIKVFGRGWDRFQSQGNPHHEFQSFNKAINGNDQFHSNFGVLDVAPINDSLHDRTLRAVANQNGFLLASSWNHAEYLGMDFSPLFFSGRRHELRERAEHVIQSPDAHRALATQFGRQYNQAFSFYRFLKHLDDLVDSQRRGRR